MTYKEARKQTYAQIIKAMNDNDFKIWNDAIALFESKEDNERQELINALIRSQQWLRDQELKALRTAEQGG